MSTPRRLVPLSLEEHRVNLQSMQRHFEQRRGDLASGIDTEGMRASEVSLLIDMYLDWEDTLAEQVKVVDAMRTKKMLERKS